MASPNRGGAAAAAAAAAPAPSFPPGTAHVDGSMLEGGGQILRNAVALSAVLNLPVAITKIRAGRDKPGLAPQHATGLKLARSLCGGDDDATLEGCEPRSTAIRFAPGPSGPLAGEGYEADTGTAGSCTLLVQQALPLLLFASRGNENENGGRKRAREPSGDGGPAPPPTSRVVLRGGTDASHAPPIGYLERVLAPTLNAWLGSSSSSSGGGPSSSAQAPPIAVSLARRGFYPRGGGEVGLSVRALPEGSSLPPLPAHQLSETPRIVVVDIYAFAAGKVRADAASRAAEGAAAPIRAALAALAATNDDDTNPSPVPVRLHTEHLPPGSGRAVGDSAGVTCVATTATPGQVLGASASGERGLRAEDMGAACGRALARQLCSGAGADEWLVDQLVVLMALAKGKSSVLCAAPLSLHARTAVAVAEQLTAAAAARGAREEERPAGVVFRQTPVEGSQERAAEAARRAGFAFSPGEPGREGLVLLECEGVGAVAGRGCGGGDDDGAGGA